MNKKILLAIPCYNCENQIVRVLEKIKKFKFKKEFLQILILDNISNDKTFNNAKNYEPKISNLKVIQNKENVNLGGSHKIIFDLAIQNNFDFIIIMHGDDQANINDINFFFEKKLFLNNRYDWYRGSRFSYGAKLIGYSRIKTFGNKFFNKIFSIISKSKIDDIGSGLDIYDVSFIKYIPYSNFPNRLTFDYFLILFANYKKFKIDYFPLEWNDTDQVSNVRLFNQTKELFKIIFNFIFNKKNMFDKKLY